MHVGTVVVAGSHKLDHDDEAITSAAYDSRSSTGGDSTTSMIVSEITTYSTYDRFIGSEILTLAIVVVFSHAASGGGTSGICIDIYGSFASCHWSDPH